MGLQLMGRPWDESMLLRLAYAAESGIPKRRPLVYFDLLPELGDG
jgi:Asp-tRNA(Asn)/Glu-tRNA(Gln) amidotransferase A subunit family amidase